MKIAICEDELSDSELLSGFLLKYKTAQSLDFSVCTYQDGDSLIKAVLDDHDIRIIFMDIYMSPVSGMDAARAVRAAGNDCLIIFTTNSIDYYAESYEIGAAHYLVKPLTYEQVCVALGRCRATLLTTSRCLEFSFNRLNFRVRTNDVRYIEVLKNTCYIHTDQVYPVVASLDYLLDRCDDSRFIRCHRSYAVNLAYIKEYKTRQVILDDNTVIPLSRMNTESFKDAYGKYLMTRLTQGGF